MVKDYADKEAERLLPAYEKMYQESLDVPDQETLLKQFDIYNARKNPTDVFGQVKKGVRRFMGSHDEETLKWNGTKQSDLLRGTPVGDEFYEWVEAVEEYEKQKGQRSGEHDGLLASIKAGMADGTIQGKMFPNSFGIIWPNI